MYIVMRKNVTIVIIIAISISTIIIYAPPASVRADGFGDYPPPANGDWDIWNETYAGNETIVLNGNLTVHPGGSLTMRNVTLIMNSPVGGATIEEFYHIEVKKYGTLSILDLDNDNTTHSDASNITLNDSNAYYWFWVRDGSNFTMRNSELRECGGWSINSGGAGLMVYTDNATIDHNLIFNNYRGIILYGSDAVASNNTISWSGHTGVVATSWSNGTIENNLIEWSGTYGIKVDGRDNTKNWASNPLIKGNTIYKTGQDGINQGDALQIETSSHPVLIDNKIIDWGEDGLYIWYRCTFDAESLMFQPDGGNFCIAGAGGLNWVRLTNSTLLSSINFDVALTGTYVVFTNTTYDNADVAFGDSISNFTARWFLNTYVDDTLGNPLPSATIRIRDNANGTFDKNFTTDANGYVNWAALTEYFQNKSTKIEYSPYNVTVSSPGYFDAWAEVEMDGSKSITLSLQKDPGDYPPPANGDWNIWNDTYAGNETILLNGNLTIHPGGSLTFRNVTLIMNSTINGEFHIEVKSFASLYILDLDNDNTTTGDASNITAYNPSLHYMFWVNEDANFTMKNSELHECGGFGIIGYSPSHMTKGLFIQTDNATVDHCHISDNYIGIVLYGSDAAVSNNTISWNEHTGIQATAWSNGTLENNLIEWGGTYGIKVDGGDNTKKWASNPLVKRNKIYKTGRDGINTGDAIHVEFSSHPIFINNDVVDWGEDGLYILYRSTFEADSMLFQPDGGNFCIVGGGGQNWVRLTNSTLLSSVNYDIALLSTTYAVFTNTSYDNADITFEDAASNFTARWFLNTYVNDTLGNPLPSANIRIRDNANGTFDKNFTTDASGYVNWTALTEYYQNQSALIGYGPYNVTVSRPGYVDAWAEVEMDESKNIALTLTPKPSGDVNLTLNPGWNLISFPLEEPKLNGTIIERASDVFNVTNCTELAIWDTVSKSYTIYIPCFNLPTDPENFVISEDDAFFVWMDDSDIFTIEGYEPVSRNVSLKSGWNMIAYKRITVGSVETDWAWQVTCGAFDDICYYENGNFIHYIFPGTVIQLVPTRGYYVWSDVDTWLTVLM